jgi:AcrR family transcriptional regulator
MEKTSRALQSEHTRERIVGAAASLFVRKGYIATSIADLAQAVEVTKGALYHHFESKEAIFFAVIEKIRVTWRDSVARKVVSSHDAIDRLSALLDNHALFLQRNEAFCLVLNGMMTELEGVKPDLAAALQQVYGELTRFVEQIIRKGQAAGQVRSDIDAALAALTIVGMLRGTACSRPISERERVDYPTIMETLKKVLISGLRA